MATEHLACSQSPLSYNGLTAFKAVRLSWVRLSLDLAWERLGLELSWVWLLRLLRCNFVGLCFEETMKTDWVGLHLGVGWVELVVKMRLGPGLR